MIASKTSIVAACIAGALACLVPAVARPAGHRVLPPAAEGVAAAVFGSEVALPDACRATAIVIREDRIHSDLECRGGRLTSVDLVEPGACDDCPSSAGFAIQVPVGDPHDADLAGAILARLLDSGDPVPWVEVVETPEEEVPGWVRLTRAIGWSAPSEDADRARTSAVGAVWLALLLGLLAGMARRGPVSPRLAWAAALIMLFCAGLALRIAFWTGGPGDFNVTVFLPMYGQAPATLLRLLEPVVGLDPLMPARFSLVFGALAPVALAIALVELGASRTTSFAAALMLAGQPLAVRWSGEGLRETTEMTLALVALWGQAAYVSRGRPRALAVSLASLVLCLQSRPEATLWLPVLALAAAFGLPRGGRRLRAVWPLVIAAVAGLLLMCPSARLIVGTGAVVQRMPGLGPFQTVWLDPDFTSPVVPVLFALGAVWAVVRRDVPVTWAALAAVALSLAASIHPTGGLVLSSARYSALALPLVSAVAGSGASALLEGAPPRFSRVGEAVMGAALVALALGTPGPMARVTLPRTIDHEYRYLARTLPDLPADADIYIANPHSRAEVGLRWLDQVSLMAGRGGQRWIEWPPEGDPTTRPRLFYYQPACSGAMPPDGRPSMEVGGIGRVRKTCREALAACGGGLWMRAELPAVRFAADTYESERIPVGFCKLSP